MTPPMRKLIHVGAHLAQERFKYDALGYQDVLWVEGSPKMAARLRKVIAEHMTTSPARHVVAEAIVTDTDAGTASIREVANDGSSTSIFPLRRNAAERWSTAETGLIETAPSRTVDSLAAEYGFLDADVLTADVQGAELLVFKGATAVLSAARAVITEISQELAYDGGVLLPELAAYLATQGYFPASRPPKRYGDMLFLKG